MFWEELQYRFILGGFALPLGTGKTMSTVDEKAYIEQARTRLEQLKKNIMSDVESHADNVRGTIHTRLSEIKRKLAGIFSH